MAMHDRNKDFSPEQAYDTLAETGAAFQDAASLLEEAQHMRDAAILVSSAQGISRRKVAAAAGVTAGRVQQVLSAADSGMQRDLADRLLQMAVNRLPAGERDRYAEEWTAELHALQLRPMARLTFVLSLLRGSIPLSKALRHEGTRGEL
ncbi:MAG TPA: hypothetical protein VF255_10720 [Solirubrobacterales bacterium]